MSGYLDQYKIGWNTFPQHLLTGNAELYQDKIFSDVTLVSDDLVQTPAHRTVLASASLKLKKLLTVKTGDGEGGQATLLYLTGVRQQELLPLLEFIYLGQTEIKENRINQFMDLARDLEIKDMKRNNEGSPSEKQPGRDEINQIKREGSGVPAPALTKPETSIVRIMENDYKVSQSFTHNNAEEYLLELVENPAQENNYKLAAGPRGTSKQPTKCPVCQAAFFDRNTMRRHHRNLHQGIRHPCPECNQSYTTNSDMVRHIKKNHS